MLAISKNLQHLIDDIEGEVRYTASYIGKIKLGKRVMQAMATVPGEKFMPMPLQSYSITNDSVPIGYGQTISQPYMVALMSGLLALKPEHNVLETGTGSDYQTAILAQLCAKLFSVERITELSKLADERFAQLSYKNIVVTPGWLVSKIFKTSLLPR